NNASSGLSKRIPGTMKMRTKEWLIGEPHALSSGHIFFLDIGVRLLFCGSTQKQQTPVQGKGAQPHPCSGFTIMV
ncbi:hypothetical protein, partial [Hoylesella loescheii]|uniref:hypothetical protein n=1 Tax=Hoylesella loescheii TaxID=840 RepID=UPI001B80E59D